MIFLNETIFSITFLLHNTNVFTYLFHKISLLTYVQYDSFKNSSLHIIFLLFQTSS